MVVYFSLAWVGLARPATSWPWLRGGLATTLLLASSGAALRRGSMTAAWSLLVHLVVPVMVGAGLPAGGPNRRAGGGGRWPGRCCPWATSSTTRAPGCWSTTSSTPSVPITSSRSWASCWPRWRSVSCCSALPRPTVDVRSRYIVERSVTVVARCGGRATWDITEALGATEGLGELGPAVGPVPLGGPPWGRGGRPGPPPWVAGLFGLTSQGEQHRGPRARRGDVRAAILDVLQGSRSTATRSSRRSPSAPVAPGSPVPDRCTRPSPSSRTRASSRPTTSVGGALPAHRRRP